MCRCLIRATATVQSSLVSRAEYANSYEARHENSRLDSVASVHPARVVGVGIGGSRPLRARISPAAALEHFCEHGALATRGPFRDSWRGAGPGSPRQSARL